MESFPKFSNLPIEIQNLIWEETASPPRIIKLYIEAMGAGGPHRHGAYSSNPLPAMMHVNSNARGEFIRMIDTITYQQNTLTTVRILNPSLVFARNDILHIQYTSHSAGEQLACVGILELLRDRNLPLEMVKAIKITSRGTSMAINGDRPIVHIFQSTRVLKDMVFCLLFFPCLAELTADFPLNQVISMSGSQKFLGDDTALWTLINRLNIAWRSGNRTVLAEVIYAPEPQFEDILGMREKVDYQYTTFDDWGPAAAKITLQLPRNRD